MPVGTIKGAIEKIAAIKGKKKVAYAPHAALVCIHTPPESDCWVRPACADPHNIKCKEWLVSHTHILTHTRTHTRKTHVQKFPSEDDQADDDDEKTDEEKQTVTYVCFNGCQSETYKMRLHLVGVGVTDLSDNEVCTHNTTTQNIKNTTEPQSEHQTRTSIEIMARNVNGWLRGSCQHTCVAEVPRPVCLITI